MRHVSGFLLLSILTVWPLSADSPVFGPELAVAEPFPAPAESTGPILSSNGDSFLLGWSSFSSSYPSDIHASLFGPAGERLVLNIVIAATAESELLLDIESDGQDYLVIWSRETSVFATRISNEGVVVSETVIDIGAGATRVAWNGSRFLFISLGTDNRLRALFTGADLTSQSSFEIMVPVRGQPYDPHLSSAGDGFLIAVDGYPPCDPDCDWRTAFTIRVGSDGTVESPRRVTQADSNVASLAASDGNYSLQLYEYARNASALNTYLLDRDGNPVRGVLTVPLSTLIATPSGFMALGFRDTTISAVRLDASGGMPEPATMVAEARNQGYPLVAASNGSRVLLAWRDSSSFTGSFYGRPTIVGLTIADSLSNALIDGVPDEAPLIENGSSQTSPAVARGGKVDVVVWDEYDFASRKATVKAVRITRDGVSLDDQGGIAIATSDASSTNPAIATDGTHFLICWLEKSGTSQQTKVRARVLGSDGALGESFDVSFGGRELSVVPVWNGASYLVVWERDFGVPSYSSTPRLFARRVSPEGTLADSGEVTLLGSDEGFHQPALAWNGTQYLMIYSRGEVCLRCYFGPSRNLYSAVITRDLQVLPSLLVGAALFDDADASVASSGQNFFVTWTVSGRDYEDDLGFIEHRDINAVLLDLEGRPFEETRTALGTAANALEERSRVAWDGFSYFVVWQQPGGTPNDVDLFGERIDAFGVRGGAYRITGGPTQETSAALAGGRGGLVLAYIRPAPELGRGSATRAFARLAFNVRRTRAVSH